MNAMPRITVLSCLAALLLTGAAWGDVAIQNPDALLNGQSYLAWEADNGDISTPFPDSPPWEITPDEAAGATYGTALVAADGATTTNPATANLVTYRLRFTVEGTYIVYYRARGADDGEGENRNDSFFAPLQFGQNPTEALNATTAQDFREVGDPLHFRMGIGYYAWYYPYNSNGMKALVIDASNVNQEVELTLATREDGIYLDRFVAVAWNEDPANIIEDPTLLDNLGNNAFDGQAWAPNPVTQASSPVQPTTLSWMTGIDTANPLQPNANVTKHYLYMVAHNESEPNWLDMPDFAGVAPVEITDVTDPIETPLPLPLLNDRIYYWRVDESINGSGPTSPATIEGTTWFFPTPRSVPVVDTQPTNAKVFPGENAQFSITATSLYQESYQWYKLGDPSDEMLTDGPDYSGAATATLTVINADELDEGAYYCEVTSQAGDATSDPALLAIKKLLAHYPFDGDANDAVGVADGAIVGGLMDFTQGVPGLPGQAADPNGSNFIDIGVDAYPTGGFGNGLEEGTISFWVKNTDIDLQVVIGVYNEADSQRIQMYVPRTSTGTFEFLITDLDSQNMETRSAETDLLDGEWHFVTVSYQGSSGTIRMSIDGVLITEDDNNAIADNFGEWEFPIYLMARNLRGEADRNYIGLLDDLRIYNYMLSETDVADVFFQGLPDADDVCILDYAGQLDSNGDCIVDLLDLAELFNHWLETGLYPACCP